MLHIQHTQLNSQAHWHIYDDLETTLYLKHSIREYEITYFKQVTLSYTLDQFLERCSVCREMYPGYTDLYLVEYAGRQLFVVLSGCLR